MYSFVATEKTAPYIREILGNKSVYEETGTFDSEGVRAVFKRVLRAARSVIIVDLGIGPGEDIVAGIRDIKIQKPSIRIIILGIGLMPGDLTITRLISLGVYDLVTFDKNEEDLLSLPVLLKEKLNSPPAIYADVARWHIIDGIDKLENDKKIIFKDKLIGTVYIAVGGSSPGTGATNTAIAIASYLGKYKKFNTALIEVKSDFDNMMCFSTLREIYKVKQGFNSNSFTLSGVDFYTGKLRDLLLSGKKYDYVVIDLGSLKKYSNQEFLASSNIEEMGRADFSILTAGNSLFRVRKDLIFFEKYLDDWTILFLPGDDPDTEEYKRYSLGEKGYYNLPIISNPLYLSPEAKEFFQTILSQVIPEDSERKKRKFIFWK